MRTMGLDLGSKTLGVAVSDAMGWTAQGLETIKINEARKTLELNDLEKLFKSMKFQRLF